MIAGKSQHTECEQRLGVLSHPRMAWGSCVVGGRRSTLGDNRSGSWGADERLTGTGPPFLRAMGVR